jgi:ABC-2 type transport system ATP-binding protein
MISQTDREGREVPPSVEAEPGVEVLGVSKRFKAIQALDQVSLQIDRGEIHALLGPNGAGKTTLLRILVGLVDPDKGEVWLNGAGGTDLQDRRLRSLFGLVPSGDRTFYLRISGLENLMFFGRLVGLRRREATARAWKCLRDVGLEDAARTPVGTYSHGMQKRLSIARALLTDPPILLIDEATHDLDPHGARTVQALITDRAHRGAAVMWTTQRVDEIRGFADRVTLLHEGRVRFAGSVPQLMARSVRRIHVLQLGGPAATGDATLLAGARGALGDLGTIAPLDEDAGERHYRLALRDGAVLGEALARLTASRIEVLSCREERSEIELAFLRLTGMDGS